MDDWSSPWADPDPHPTARAASPPPKPKDAPPAVATPPAAHSPWDDPWSADVFPDWGTPEPVKTPTNDAATKLGADELQVPQRLRHKISEPDWGAPEKGDDSTAAVGAEPARKEDSLEIPTLRHKISEPDWGAVEIAPEEVKPVENRGAPEETDEVHERHDALEIPTLRHKISEPDWGALETTPAEDKVAETKGVETKAQENGWNDEWAAETEPAVKVDEDATERLEESQSTATVPEPAISAAEQEKPASPEPVAAEAAAPAPTTSEDRKATPPPPEAPATASPPAETPSSDEPASPSTQSPATDEPVPIVASSPPPTASAPAAPTEPTASPTPPPEDAEDEDDDEFGDFASETSTVPDFDAADASTAVSTAPTPSRSPAPVPHKLPPLPIPLDKLDTLYPRPTSVPDLPPAEHDPLYTTSARKAYYRLTTAPSLRRARAGGEEDYVRITWRHSRIREEVGKVVERWVREEKVGPRWRPARRGTGGGMFSWSGGAETGGNSGEGGWKRMSAQVLPVRKTEHARTRSEVVVSPVVANFGWGTEGKGAGSGEEKKAGVTAGKQHGLSAAPVNPGTLPLPKKGRPDALEGLKGKTPVAAAPLSPSIPPPPRSPSVVSPGVPSPGLQPPAKKNVPAPISVPTKKEEEEEEEEEDEWGMFNSPLPTPKAEAAPPKPPTPAKTDEWSFFETAPPATSAPPSTSSSSIAPADDQWAAFESLVSSKSSAVSNRNSLTLPANPPKLSSSPPDYWAAFDSAPSKAKAVLGGNPKSPHKVEGLKRPFHGRQSSLHIVETISHDDKPGSASVPPTPSFPPPGAGQNNNALAGFSGLAPPTKPVSPVPMGAGQNSNALAGLSGLAPPAKPASPAPTGAGLNGNVLSGFPGLAPPTKPGSPAPPTLPSPPPLKVETNVQPKQEEKKEEEDDDDEWGEMVDSTPTVEFPALDFVSPPMSAATSRPVSSDFSAFSTNSFSSLNTLAQTRPMSTDFSQLSSPAYNSLGSLGSFTASPTPPRASPLQQRASPIHPTASPVPANRALPPHTRHARPLSTDLSHIPPLRPTPSPPPRNPPFRAPPSLHTRTSHQRPMSTDLSHLSPLRPTPSPPPSFPALKPSPASSRSPTPVLPPSSPLATFRTPQRPASADLAPAMPAPPKPAPSAAADLAALFAPAPSSTHHTAPPAAGSNTNTAAPAADPWDLSFFETPKPAPAKQPAPASRGGNLWDMPTGGRKVTPEEETARRIVEGLPDLRYMNLG